MNGKLKILKEKNSCNRKSAENTGFATVGCQIYKSACWFATVKKDKVRVQKAPDEYEHNVFCEPKNAGCQINLEEEE